MGSKSSDYLDRVKKDEIKKAILFFKEGGWQSKDEICELISKDFDVSRTAVFEIYREIEKTENPPE